jgi:hypothetical protein
VTARTILRSAGSSASGTPGTTVADIQATSTYKLVEWFVIASQTSTASTQVRITVTYSDATTTTFDSAAATGTGLFANAAGGLRNVSAVPNLVTAFDAKDVTRVQVTTLGTGTGTRYGTVSATQVPQ